MRARGFSLLEMLLAVVVFLVITGAVFLLLNTAQQRYVAESQQLDAFQSARIALDQITRDVHDTGYPPVVSVPANVAAASPQLVAFPFAWDPGYPNPPCTVGGTCGNPNGYSLILESNAADNPVPPALPQVQWIRYSLGTPANPCAGAGTTLYRGVTPKVVPGPLPVVATCAAGVMVPYVENVMNNAPAAQIALIRASYPSMFPGGAAVPIFTYALESGGVCSPPVGPPPVTCIREVDITLIVQSEQLDPKTRQPRLVTLAGMARRINPSH